MVAKFHRTDIARRDARPQCREIGIEAPVEPGHKGHARCVDGVDTGADIVHRHVDGLFAEDRLSARRAVDQVEMGVGGRADHHGVDVVGGKDGLGAPDFGADLAGQRLCRGRHASARPRRVASSSARMLPA
jgi:hypothetical protein